MIKGILKLEDFYGKVDIAAHCDKPKLAIAINDAFSFDLPQIFCDLYGLIHKLGEVYISDKESLTPIELMLFDGGVYSCGYNRNLLGVKDMAVFYSYARYTVNSNYIDTGSGLKTKTNEFSLPTSHKEILAISDEFRNKGFLIYKQILDFICHNKEAFKIHGFQISCESCGCTRGCVKGQTTGYGYKPKMIKKRR